MKLARKRLGPISNLVFISNGIYHDPTGHGKIVHLPILSFLVRAPPELGGFLHHNFVCSLLNDLVGSPLSLICQFFKRIKNEGKVRPRDVGRERDIEGVKEGERG